MVGGLHHRHRAARPDPGSFPLLARQLLRLRARCDDLHDPPIAWTGHDTYIQHRAINSDLGTYDSPDAFYAGHPSNVSGLKGLAWRWAYYRPTNRNVEQIRTGRFPDTPEKHVTACPQRNRENGEGS